MTGIMKATARHHESGHTTASSTTANIMTMMGAAVKSITSAAVDTKPIFWNAGGDMDHQSLIKLASDYS
jgi:hypothetical protein